MTSVAKHLAPAVELERRPMARAARVPLIERVVHEKIGDAALEVIFTECHRISEGDVHKGRYFGSTMLTIDLQQLKSTLRIESDRQLDALAVLFAEDDRVTRRVQRLAERDAVARANVPLTNVAVETRVRTDGSRIFIDADVEATLRDG